jgi:hypothetical protein
MCFSLTESAAVWMIVLLLVITKVSLERIPVHLISSHGRFLGMEVFPGLEKPANLPRPPWNKCHDDSKA